MLKWAPPILKLGFFMLFFWAQKSFNNHTIHTVVSWKIGIFQTVCKRLTCKYYLWHFSQDGYNEIFMEKLHRSRREGPTMCFSILGMCECCNAVIMARKIVGTLIIVAKSITGLIVIAYLLVLYHVWIRVCSSLEKLSKHWFYFACKIAKKFEYF